MVSRYTYIQDITTQERLIERIKASDDSAFDRLFRLCYPLLTDFALRYIHSREDAEELVADLFVRIWEMRKSWEVRGMITTYLFTSVRNRAFDMRASQNVEERRRTRINSYLSQDADDTSFAVMLESERTELSPALQKALSALPPRALEIFLLTKRDGLSIREAAEVLGVAPSTVQTQLLRAINSLKTGLSYS